MNFDDFTFLNILEYSFIREEDGIRHNFAFLKRITLGNNPPLNFPFLIGIFLLIVFLSIFHHSLVPFLILILLVPLVLWLVFLLDGD